MIQVHIINNANRHLYERELDEHHQIRHRIYVEELQWRRLKPRADKREYDPFDMDETVYVLALEEGRVVGGRRLVPTTGPHLIADVFPHFASMQGVPRAPDIAEWTRLFVVPERRKEHSGAKIRARGAFRHLRTHERILAAEIPGMWLSHAAAWLARHARRRMADRGDD